MRNLTSAGAPRKEEQPTQRLPGLMNQLGYERPTAAAYHSRASALPQPDRKNARDPAGGRRRAAARRCSGDARRPGKRKVFGRPTWRRGRTPDGAAGRGAPPPGGRTETRGHRRGGRQRSVSGGRWGRLQWILPSQPTGYNPVGEPSTRCGTLRQRHNANSRITGREAHQNDGSNANATMIYSNTHDDPKAYTHIPSETRRRTCTIPTLWRYHGRTGTQRATASGPGL